ncbi:MAG: GntR family transcriptional regulator [Rhodospirillales bacterium]|nr:GntR family transcriptional regulator [Rhodospirillales bacterium]
MPVSNSSAFQLLDIKPLQANVSLRKLACDAIKQAITKMNIYDQFEEIRLDERQLSRDLGVSRTPIREALSLLEHEGFLRSVPRGGIFIVRKNKREILEMIAIWSAMESMAARLACEKASDEELVKLRELAAFKKDPGEHVNEYAQSSMEFHRAIMAMSKCNLMVELTENLFIHMRAIRSVTMRQDDRAQRSLVEHMNIVDALEARDPDLSARRVGEHTMGLAAYIEKYGNFLDQYENKTSSRKIAAR